MSIALNEILNEIHIINYKICNPIEINYTTEAILMKVILCHTTNIIRFKEVDVIGPYCFCNICEYSFKYKQGTGHNYKHVIRDKEHIKKKVMLFERYYELKKILELYDEKSE